MFGASGRQRTVWVHVICSMYVVGGSGSVQRLHRRKGKFSPPFLADLRALVFYLQVFFFFFFSVKMYVTYCSASLSLQLSGLCIVGISVTRCLQNKMHSKGLFGVCVGRGDRCV